MEWVTKGLDEVLFIQEGPGIRKYEYEDGGYPMINVRCVQDGYVDMSKSRSANYELATTKWKHFQVEENDILYTISGTIGRSAIVKKSDLPLLMNTSVVRFRSLTEYLDTKFVYYAFKTDTFINELLGHSTGTAIKNVGPSHLKKMSISYPSVPEQKRIVALLDTVFVDLEQTRAKTEQNLKNARELFDSYLQQVFSQKGDDWVDNTLGSICGFQNGFAFKSKDTLDTSNTQLIRMGNLYQNILDLNRKPAFYPNSFYEEHERYQLHKGDLIISLTGTVGKEDYGYTVEIPSTDRKLLLNQRIAKFVNIDSSLIEKGFLFRFLRSRVFLDKLYMTARGTRQANLSTVTMSEMSISYPSIHKQEELISVIDELEKNVFNLEKIYKKKLNAIDELKKSILQKVFNGELTTTTK